MYTIWLDEKGFVTRCSIEDESARSTLLIVAIEHSEVDTVSDEIPDSSN